MNWYVAVLKKYAEFNGRAQRKEFWLFSFVNLLIGFSILYLADLFPGLRGFRYWLFFFYSLVVLTPWVAVAVRRLHDVGLTGWWVLFGFVFFIVTTDLPARNIGDVLIRVIVGLGFALMMHYLVLDSHPGANQYGPDPKERTHGGTTFSEQQNRIKNLSDTLGR